MSIKIMNLVWDHESNRLSPTEKIILVKMADYGNDEGTNIFPSYKTLARKTNLSSKTVYRSIKSLIAKGYVHRHRIGISRFRSSDYGLNLNMLKENCGFDYGHPDNGQKFDYGHDVHQTTNNNINIFISKNLTDTETKKRKEIKNKITEQPNIKINSEKASIIRQDEPQLNLGHMESKESSKTTTQSPNARYDGIKDVGEEKIVMEEKNDIFTMIGIWKEEVNKDETIIPSQKLKDGLRAALETKFDNSVDKWRTYCRRVAENDFLMGINKYGWKAQIHWGTKPEKIDSVMAGVIYQKKKPFKSKADDKLIELTKDQLIDEVFASSESDEIKMIRIALIDYMNSYSKNLGLISYHTYLRHAQFKASEIEGKKTLKIYSSYNAFNSLMSFHDLITTACGDFEEVTIYGGTNDRLGNKFYLDRKSTTVPSPIYLWEQKCIEKGIESIMMISTAMIASSKIG